MKKIFLLFAVLLMGNLCFATTMRDTLPILYQQGEFLSNWSVGLNGGVTFNTGDAGTYHGLGFGVYAERPISYVFDVRLSFGMRVKDGMQSACYPFTTGVTMDWIDLFSRVKRTHRFEVYSIAGLGVCYNTNGDYYTNDALSYDGYAGLGIGWVLGKDHQWKIRLESAVDGMSRIMDWGSYTMYQNTTLGVQYNFGLTKADKLRNEMVAMIKAEEDAMFDCAQECLRCGWRRADTMEHEVHRLETELLSTVHMYDSIIYKKDSTISAYDSLLSAIRESQLNTYALPFSVMFDLNSYKINESEYTKLDQIAKSMKADGGKFKVVGFASSDGGEAYNLKLSQKRVDAIYRYLIRKGVPADNLDKDAKGESVLFGDGGTELNRRVSFYRIF